MEYLDFDLQIGFLENGRYPVSVRSPAGEARESFTFPYNDWQLHDKLRDLELALRASPDLRQVTPPELRSVQKMGQDFFDSLLPGELRTRFDISQRMASEQGKGLRIRLHIMAPELGVLPWEYLYDPRPCEYLCLSTLTPIIRYLEVSQPVLPLKITPPLHVIGMVCSPRDLARLDVKQEKWRIEKALTPLQEQGLVNIHWIEGSTWRDLQQEVCISDRAGVGWHVFHFIGHGKFDEISDEGQVVLECEDGKADFLSATGLARLLADQRSLRLVVLNTCEGALGSVSNAFSSTASILVRRGIATVIAMQHAVSDRTAIELARTFYENLAKGVAVDAALGEARKAISLALPGSVEWGTPVLFMRAPEGILFQVQPQAFIRPAVMNTHIPNIEPEPTPTDSEEIPPPSHEVIKDEHSLSNAYHQMEEELVQTGSPIDADSKSKHAETLKSSLITWKLAHFKNKRRLMIIAGILAIFLLIWGAVRLFYSGPDSVWISSIFHFPVAKETLSLVPVRENGIKTMVSPIDGMVMIYVPEGSFSMGAVDTDANANASEKPQHDVYLDAYWIDQTEVTIAQYAKCVEKKGCTTPPDKSSSTRASYYDNPDFANFPVVYVSWNDATSYCTWAQRRLPTEAEWEKAARGDDKRKYPWGNKNPDCTLANSLNDATGRLCAGDTSAVGSYPDGASYYQVFDMAGNVWEWVNDWWQSDYYNISPSTNPPGPARGATNYRALRGSYWRGDWHSLRTEYRYYSTLTSRSNRTGFRCADTQGH